MYPSEDTTARKAELTLQKEASNAKKAALKNLPKKLWQCNTPEQQTLWCEQRLLAGGTLTDPAVFLGGACPETIIRTLRKRHKIKTIRVTATDATNTKHRVPAWQLDPLPEKSPQ